MDLIARMLAVSTKNKENVPKRFLRRPLVPKVLPKLPLTPPPDHSTATKSLTGEFLVEPEFYYEEGEYPPRPPDYMFDRSGTSPPPPSEHHTITNSTSHKKSYSASNHTIVLQKSNIVKHVCPPQLNVQGKFILDPLHRGGTSLGTYVEGKSLVMPLKPRGPAPLPARVPVKTNAPPTLMDEDEFIEDLRYQEPPQFTLQDFLQTVSEKENVPLVKVQEIVYSKHNYKKMQNLLMEHVSPKSTTLTKVTLQPSGEGHFCTALTLTLPSPYVGMGGSLTVTVA